MPENKPNDYRDTCSIIEKAIQDLNVRARVSDQNRKLQDSYTSQIKTLEENIAVCNGVMDIMKPMLDDIQVYIAERRKNSMQSMNNALRMAGEIIQDSTEGIYFKIDGDEAWLATPDGLEADMVEGGGYRQISSTFIRSVVLGVNNGTLDTLLLDEIFALVSPENSAALSLYLNVICQDKQVISIEQKPQVYSNIDSVMYTFSKGTDYAEVHKSIIKHGEFDGVREEKVDAV